MIHNEQDKVKEILAEAFELYRHYYPDGGFNKKPVEWHKKNLTQTVYDLSRNPRTMNLKLEILEETLQAGINGDFDGDKYPNANLTTPVVMKWIGFYKAKKERENSSTGYQYEEPIYTGPIASGSTVKAASWLLYRSFGRRQIEDCKKFDQNTLNRALEIIDNDPRPERFAEERETIEQELSLINPPF